MRIIAFSDLHSDSHEDFSYQLPNGLNSRLSDCLDVIDKVTYYRDKYECDLVLFSGDMFHTPSVTDTVVFQETYKRLEKLAESSKNFIIIAGNHDMASGAVDGIPVSTVYATSRLPHTKIVVAEYKSVIIDNVVVHCLPYIKDPYMLDKHVDRMRAATYDRKFKSMDQIVTTHIGLDEAVNGPNEIKLRKGYSVSKLLMMRAKKILSGHHHHPQRFSSLDIIGSSMQMNMLDRGDRRGLLVYDTKTDKVVRIWLSGSKFFLYEIRSRKDFDKLKRERDDLKDGYVRVTFDPHVVSESRVVDFVSSAKMYKILPVRQVKSGIRSEEITSKALANIGNLASVVEDYVEHIDPKGLKKGRLISIGKMLIGP